MQPRCSTDNLRAVKQHRLVGSVVPVRLPTQFGSSLRASTCLGRVKKTRIGNLESVDDTSCKVRSPNGALRPLTPTLGASRAPQPSR
jgi:hypothetical protein